MNLSKKINDEHLSSKIYSLENENKILKKINESINNLLFAKNLEDSLKIFLDNCLDIINGSNGSILLYDENRKTLKIRAAKGLSEKTVNKTRIFPGQGISGKLIENKCNIIYSKDSNLISNKRGTERDFSFISVPLFNKNKILGVINISNPVDKQDFSDKDLKLIKPLAAQVSLIIENFELMNQFNQITNETIQAFVHAIEAKDSNTEGHCQRVTLYSYSIAREYGGFTENDLMILQYGAMLHDIGKIGIDNEILLKPDKLNEREFEEIKRHPLLGSNIISPISSFKDVRACVLYHHSWYNEKGGYPLEKMDNKKNKIMSNIIGVADVYDAMSSARPYRDKICYDEIKKILLNGRNNQFDPKAVDILINQIENRISYKTDFVNQKHTELLKD